MDDFLVERLKNKVKLLEEENDVLREQLRQLRLNDEDSFVYKVCFGLTIHEAEIMVILMKNEIISKARLMTQLYAMNPDEAPEIKIIDVFICNLRQKLKLHSIKITTHWGVGYGFSPADKEKARAVIKASGLSD